MTPGFEIEIKFNHFILNFKLKMKNLPSKIARSESNEKLFQFRCRRARKQKETKNVIQVVNAFHANCCAILVF